MTQSHITMSRHYEQFSASERGQIEAYLTPRKLSDDTIKGPLKQCEMVRLLGRDKATISREIKRGSTTQIKANHTIAYVIFSRYWFRQFITKTS